MYKLMLLLLLSICIAQTSFAHRGSICLACAPEDEVAVPGNKEKLYKGLRTGAIVMEVSGTILMLAGVKTQIDASRKISYANGDTRPDPAPLYITGGSLLIGGIALNIFANSKLKHLRVQPTGNGISYNIPHTNAHFGR